MSRIHTYMDIFFFQPMLIHKKTAFWSIKKKIFKNAFPRKKILMPLVTVYPYRHEKLNISYTVRLTLSVCFKSDT